MIFQRVTPDRYNDVILHLRESFFFDEPLNKSVELCTAGTGNEELEKYSIATLEDGLSVMAVNDREEVSRHNDSFEILSSTFFLFRRLPEWH